MSKSGSGSYHQIPFDLVFEGNVQAKNRSRQNLFT